MPVAEGAQRGLCPLELRQGGERVLGALVVASEVEPPETGAEREPDDRDGDERAVDGKLRGAEADRYDGLADGDVVRLLVAAYCFEGAREGSLIVDCSTIAPSGSWDFAARLARARRGDGRRPGLGRQRGRPEGDADDLRRWRRGRRRARPALLAAMGKTITHVGPIGAGQAVKAVNQVILAGTYLGVAEGIVLAIKAGLDVEQVVGALGGGAAQSWVLANRSGRMIANDYPLGFKVALHRKDLGIALELAASSERRCRSAPSPRSSRPA